MTSYLLTPEGYPICVGCGYCCKQAPCAFGELAESGEGCRFIVRADGRYWCGIYDHIIQDPSSDIAPAFGAGCSCPHNKRRLTLICEGRLYL